MGVEATDEGSSASPLLGLAQQGNVDDFLTELAKSSNPAAALSSQNGRSGPLAHVLIKSYIDKFRQDILSLRKRAPKEPAYIQRKTDSELEIEWPFGFPPGAQKDDLFRAGHEKRKLHDDEVSDQNRSIRADYEKAIEKHRQEEVELLSKFEGKIAYVISSLDTFELNWGLVDSRGNSLLHVLSSQYQAYHRLDGLSPSLKAKLKEIVNYKNKDGQTAFMVLFKRGLSLQPSGFLFFKDIGVDLSITDNRGRNFLAYVFDHPDGFRCHFYHYICKEIVNAFGKDALERLFLQRDNAGQFPLEKITTKDYFATKGGSEVGFFKYLNDFFPEVYTEGQPIIWSDFRARCNNLSLLLESPGDSLEQRESVVSRVKSEGLTPDDLSDRLTSDPNPKKTASALRAVSQKGSAEEPSWIKKNPRAATAIGVTASVSALAVVGTLVRKYLLKQKQKKEEEKEQLLAKFKVKQ
jgi:hypothetical protein